MLKIGERVKVVGSDYAMKSSVGETGVIEDVLGDDKYGVRLDRGDWDSAYETDLQLITPAAPQQAAPTHIVIEGVRYKLTPEPEGEPEQKRRTPQAGEVWWDMDGDLMLVLDTDDAETGMPATVYLNGGCSGDMGHADPNDGDFFAYPSLAAAIKAGETFE